MVIIVMEFEISARELSRRLRDDEDILLLDVREPEEHDIAVIENSLLMPMRLVPQRINELDPDQHTVVICHHGMRSAQVVDFLQNAGFKKVQNLSGGIDAWTVEVDSTLIQY